MSLYPARARDAGIEGLTVLDCTVAQDGSLADCAVTKEIPSGQGFGEAALKGAAGFKMKTVAVDGTSMIGKKVRVPIKWRLREPPAIVVETAGLAVNPEPINSPSPIYSAETRAKGVEGEVWVRGTVGVDGALTDVAIKTGSGSPELDQLSLDAFKQWTFSPGQDATLKPVPAVVATKFEFEHEPVMALPKMTCADFVAEVSGFDKSFPNRKHKEMRLYTMTLGLIAMGGMNKGGTEWFLHVAKAFPTAYDTTFARCAETPKANYLETIIKAL